MQAPAQAEVQPVLNTPDVFRVVHPNSAQVGLILKISFVFTFLCGIFNYEGYAYKILKIYIQLIFG